MSDGYRVIASSLGTLHQHVCYGCGNTWATYPGGFPRRWKRVDGRVWCLSCSRAVRRQAEKRAAGRLM